MFNVIAVFAMSIPYVPEGASIRTHTYTYIHIHTYIHIVLIAGTALH